MKMGVIKMFLYYILQIGIVVLAILFAIFQIIIPTITDSPLFSILRETKTDNTIKKDTDSPDN